MLKLETYVCDDCGAEFQSACFAEFKEKEKKHKCKLVNKRVARTNERKQKQVAQGWEDSVADVIEQCNFNNLVRQGVVVCIQ